MKAGDTDRHHLNNWPPKSTESLITFWLSKYLDSFQNKDNVLIFFIVCNEPSLGYISNNSSSDNNSKWI